jgi:hypothetical protein
VGLLNSELYDVEFVPETELQDLVAMEAKDKDVSQQEFAGVDCDADTDDESITEELKVRWLNQDFEYFKLSSVASVDEISTTCDDVVHFVVK